MLQLQLNLLASQAQVLKTSACNSENLHCWSRREIPQKQIFLEDLNCCRIELRGVNLRTSRKYESQCSKYFSLQKAQYSRTFYIHSLVGKLFSFFQFWLKNKFAVSQDDGSLTKVYKNCPGFSQYHNLGCIILESTMTSR